MEIKKERSKQREKNSVKNRKSSTVKMKVRY